MWGYKQPVFYSYNFCSCNFWFITVKPVPGIRAGIPQHLETGVSVVLTVLHDLWKHHHGCCASQLIHFRQVEQLMLAGKARLSTPDTGERRLLLPCSAQQPMLWEPAPSTSVHPCQRSKAGPVLEYRVDSYDTRVNATPQEMMGQRLSQVV